MIKPTMSCFCNQLGASVQKGTDQVGKTSLCQVKENQSSGGINVSPIFVQRNIPGVKVLDVFVNVSSVRYASFPKAPIFIVEGLFEG